MEVVRRVFSLIEPRANNQNVELQIIEPAQTQTIDADGEQIFQVLLNLCGNALDVMPNGGSLAVQVESANGAVPENCSETGPSAARPVVASAGFTLGVMPPIVGNVMRSPTRPSGRATMRVESVGESTSFSSALAPKKASGRWDGSPCGTTASYASRPSG